MGKHAVISAGTNEFGNERHKLAPRVRVTERVTGYAQQEKSNRLAGQVRLEKFAPMTGPTTLEMLIADRKVTSMTATMTQYRKVSATRWELNMRAMGARIIVRKVTTKSFTGWIAEFMPYSGGRVVLGAVPKGGSINHNGESEDTRRMALVNLHSALIKAAN